MDNLSDAEFNYNLPYQEELNNCIKQLLINNGLNYISYLSLRSIQEEINVTNKTESKTLNNFFERTIMNLIGADILNRIHESKKNKIKIFVDYIIHEKLPNKIDICRMYNKQKSQSLRSQFLENRLFSLRKKQTLLNFSTLNDAQLKNIITEIMIDRWNAINPDWFESCNPKGGTRTRRRNNKKKRRTRRR